MKLNAAAHLRPLEHAGQRVAPASRVDPADQREQLARQAQLWVGQTFFGVMLKQMRESPFKSELFSGGRGGQAFSELYDQKLIEQMSRGVGQKLVKSIVRKLEAAAAYRRQGGPIAPAEPACKGQPRAHSEDRDPEQPRRPVLRAAERNLSPHQQGRAHVAIPFRP